MGRYRNAVDEARRRQRSAQLANLARAGTDFGAGLFDTAATLASGSVAAPLSGLAGLAALPFEMLPGGDGFAANTVRGVQDALT